MKLAIDPTAYALGGDASLTDPRERRLNGVANHGRHRIEMPFMTQVTDNLWHGGVEHGLVLPEFVDFKLSLYQWEDYWIGHDLKDSLTVEMYDSLDQGFEQVAELAEWVNERRAQGTVFVHCQAGLNRSSLVVAKALLLAGDVSTGQEAIDLIRARRDPACLCNPAFEAWVAAQ
ncbi:dual specificity protein phosphatase family protein [Microbacterium sp. BG28]|uniref:protein-tyrosine phosphatase family protein n=1 Tax=Microbacterium sp. BG28 TaxID=3097356 RepID=UPI002A5AE02F|nr:dual specificity protein phosphatase family protein [Microbacterium sp. BG28]MDY0829071.1 dual specificity protein phosphatase family protein [Microbacterium sp. BG28]